MKLLAAFLCLPLLAGCQLFDPYYLSQSEKSFLKTLSPEAQEVYRINRVFERRQLIRGLWGGSPSTTAIVVENSSDIELHRIGDELQRLNDRQVLDSYRPLSYSSKLAVPGGSRYVR